MWYNGAVAALLRSPLHPLVSGQMMLITYTGRKSGVTYSTPVNYVRDEEVLWIVSSRERTWWRNMRGGLPVSLRLCGREAPAAAVVVESEAGVAKALNRICELDARYARALGIVVAENGTADEDALRRAAQSRVVVRAVVQDAAVQQQRKVESA